MPDALVTEIEDAYRRRTPRSAEYHRRARAYLPGGDTRSVTFFEPHPLYVGEGRGACLTDLDGHVYLDFLGNYTSMVHGHGHPALIRAVTEQVEVGTGYAANHPHQIALAEEICRRLPGVQSLRFCNSGTEAVMHALRLARAFTGRRKIVKMEGGYHGSSDLTEISVTPDPARAGPVRSPRAVPEEPGILESVVGDVLVVPFNDSQALEATFAHHGADVAAVIVEPMLGAAGTIPGEPEFLATARRICDEYGALLVFDEVITVRLGVGGAQGHYGVRPDLTTLGKVIGGGLPVGAFGGRSDVMSLLAPPDNVMTHSGTFNANPLTMAAGLVALQLLDEAAVARLSQLGTRLAAGLRNALRDEGVVARVTGLGSLWTVHFTDCEVRDYRGVASAHAETRRLFHLGLITQGVFIAPRGMFAVNTVMTEAEVDTAVDVAGEVLRLLAPYLAREVPRLRAA